MNRSVRTRAILLLDIALLLLGCGENKAEGDNSRASSGNGSFSTRPGASGGQSVTSGKQAASTVTSRGGNDAGSTVSALGGRGSETPATIALGGTLSSHQGGSLGNSSVASGGAQQGGNPTTGGVGTVGTTRSGGAGGAQTGGATSTTGGTGTLGTATGGAHTGGTTAPTGGTATGGTATGGTATGGTSTTGGTTSNAEPDGYRINGIHGYVYLAQDGSMDEGARAGAVFYDAPMRVDAFAAFPPELHELKLQQGACILTKAATRACNPPCSDVQYCGAGNTCKPAPKIVSAGNVSIEGPVSTTTLTPSGAEYPSLGMALQNIASGATVRALSTGGDIPAFSLNTLGVDTTDLAVEGAPSFELKDGESKVLRWTERATGTVQLLLNAGWHGAPPTGTLVCEAPASAGELVVPQALVEAFPPESGMGLNRHTSAVRLIQRKYVRAGSSTLELLVVGVRVVISVTH